AGPVSKVSQKAGASKPHVPGFGMYVPPASGWEKPTSGAIPASRRGVSPPVGVTPAPPELPPEPPTWPPPPQADRVASVTPSTSRLTAPPSGPPRGPVRTARPERPRDRLAR